MEACEVHKYGLNNYVKGKYKVKWIEDDGIRGKHRGQEIWVIGCGYQLDDFQDDFFDDKISIGVNWVRFGFPNCTYYHWWHSIYNEFALYEDPNIFKKCIISWPSERWGPDNWGHYVEWPIWMLWEHVIYKEETMVENVRRIFNNEPCGYGSMNTVIHTAVQAAAVFGASKIILVGADFDYYDSSDRRKSYCKKFSPYCRGMSNHHQFKDDPKGYTQQMKRGIKILTDEFAKYGVEVCRYNPKRGYYPIDGKDIVEWDQIGFEKPWKK